MRRSVLLLLVLVGLVAGCSGRPARQPTPAVPGVVVAYLRDDATTAQKDAIESKLRGAPGASGVRFVSREEAYRQFKKTFKDRPDLVKTVRPEDLPESYRVRLADRTDAPKLLAKIRPMPGVKTANLVPLPSPSATP